MELITCERMPQSVVKFTTHYCKCGKIHHSHVLQKQYLCSEKSNMKKLHYKPLEDVVCDNVLHLLHQRNISIRQLADSINMDHSNLHKILRRKSARPTYLIDHFAEFFGVDRIALMTDKHINYHSDDQNNMIHLSIHIPSFNIYKQVIKLIKSIQS